MKKNEELLHRCFDGDLNDDEMRILFAEMSNNDALRMQFRALQTVRNELQSLPVQQVPASLDEKIKRLQSTSSVRMISNKSALRRVVMKKFTLSMPAFAATVLLLLAGSYFVTTEVLTPKVETELVYIMQLPQIEVYGTIN